MARVPVKHPAGTRGWCEYLQTLYSLPPEVSSESIFPHNLPLLKVTPVARLPSSMKRMAPCYLKRSHQWPSYSYTLLQATFDLVATTPLCCPASAGKSRRMVL